MDTVKETWIDKLIDELIDAKDDASIAESDSACLRGERRALEKANIRLIDTILDNTRLDYEGKALTINSDTELMYLLKREYPDEYNERLNQLKRTETADEEAQ